MKDERTKVKGILILFFLSIFNFQFSICTAQPRLRTPEYYLGFHGGVSMSTVSFTPTVQNMSSFKDGWRLGGNGGLVFRYAGHKYCGLQVELNYLHRGWGEHNDTIGTYTRSLNYIEIPMLMHLNFGSDKCRWFLNLGPQIGYCIKDEGNHGTLVNDADAAEYQSLDKPFDWGILVGTGILIPSKKAGTYHLEIRFDYSFGGLYNNNLTDHFRAACPMDLSVNLGWVMPVRLKRN